MAYGFEASLINSFLDTNFATAGTWLRLHTGDPGAAGTANQAAGDTTRKQATMAAAAAGSKAASASVGPFTNGGTSETINGVSIWSASTAGTFKASASHSGVAWASGNTITYTAFSVAITPIAA